MNPLVALSADPMSANLPCLIVSSANGWPLSPTLPAQHATDSMPIATERCAVYLVDTGGIELLEGGTQNRSLRIQSGFYR